MIQALASPANPQASATPSRGPGSASPEEALARSALEGGEDAVPAVIDALALSFRAAAVVLVPAEPSSAVGVVRSGIDAASPGLTDPALVQRVLDSTEPVWAAGLPGATQSSAGWRVGFRIAVDGKVLGAVIVAGRDEPDRVLTGAGRAALTLAVAMGLQVLRQEARVAPERALPAGSISRVPRTAIQEPPIAPDPPPPTVLEYPLGGEPSTMPARELFALFPEIVGRSTAIRGVLQSVWVAARSDIPVLIEGESGTGKELVARAIHRASRRTGSPFLSENCGALPENLAEAEFFGHERGAFTGADRARPGLFERAAGGTVFLDEVSEMDLSLQRKLLRVLQEKEVRRLGGAETTPVDFRILAATNRVLEDMVRERTFREDLYYRLNVATLSMPPLRERVEDIPLLVDHFNRLFAGELRREPLEICPGALRALLAYRWPGNIRELRNELWRLACAGDARAVDASRLSARIIRKGPSGSPPRAAGAEEPLVAIERNALVPAIVEALRTARGNRTEAARRLGISRGMLYRRLRRYGLASRRRGAENGQDPGKARQDRGPAGKEGEKD